MQKKFIYFSVLLLFIACHRETPIVRRPYPPGYQWNPPSYKSCRLDEMSSYAHRGGTDSGYNFVVDTLGKLQAVRIYAGFNLYYDYKLTYDSANHLVKVTSPFSNSRCTSSTFSYNSNGLLSEIGGRQADSVRMRFVYGSSTIPDKCIEYTYTSSNNTWDSIEHRYTVQNGNIVMIEAIQGGVSINKAYYDYDTNILNFDKPFCLISQFVLPMGLFEEVQPFNKNVLKTKTPAVPFSYLGEPYSMTYTMDSIWIRRTDLKWQYGNTDTWTYQYYCH